MEHHPGPTINHRRPPAGRPLASTRSRRGWGAVTTGLLTVAIVIGFAAHVGDPTVTGHPVAMKKGVAADYPGSGDLPLSRDTLRGAWYQPTFADGSVTPGLARFSPDGTFALGGVLDRDAWATGTFQVRPTGVTFVPTGG